MEKVIFEVEYDEILNVGYLERTADLFKSEESRGKKFLLNDPLTGNKQLVLCKAPSDENNKYAELEYFPLPANAVIVEKPDPKEELMSHIQDCCDKICLTIQEAMKEQYNDLAIFISKEFDTYKSEGVGSSGISEKTLLSALEIVTKHK